MRSFSDQTIALAGIYQAAALTRQVARTSSSEAAATESMIRSLFKIDAADVEDVFGGVVGVTTGLRGLVNQLQGTTTRDLEVTRYLINLMQLERALERHPDLLEKIRRGIESTRSRLAHFELLHPNILAQLADIYLTTVSTLKPRIMVTGDPRFLSDPGNKNRIRTLLLAGIRSAMLWRQCGGTRWRILVRRKQVLQTARQLLERIEGDTAAAPQENSE
jgi:high frequency lysogenization protein